MDHPRLRLDFILISKSIVDRWIANRGFNHNFNMASAGVDNQLTTESISDHFPVFAKWPWRLDAGTTVDLF